MSSHMTMLDGCPLVGGSNLQPVIIREADENQSPDVIIFDELHSHGARVEAAKTIARQGLQLIATAHDNRSRKTLNCQERGSLVGGTIITLSSHEADPRADKRGKRYSRRHWSCIVETKWIFHPNSYFAGEAVNATELYAGIAAAVKAMPQEGRCTSQRKAASSQRKAKLHAPPPPPQAGQHAAGGLTRTGKRRGHKRGIK
jgi:hypothetical protein